MRRNIDIGGIVALAETFNQELRRQKEAIAGDFRWYPYSSFGNLLWLDRMLTGGRRHLLEMAGDDPVLDVGCADGDLAFLLESLGCRVHAVDLEHSNYNGMRGVRRLAEVRGSNVTVTALDIDARFELPAKNYGLVIALGLLYHLKNPFYFLETLSRHARYLLLSTRVARLTPDHQCDVRRYPLAYLLGEDEVNDDASNFWIFTEPALRRILERSRWRILDFGCFGSETSDPVSAEGDERAYLLARSWVVDPVTTADLGEGWHELENGRWRWTARRFAATFRDCHLAPYTSVSLDFVLHPDLFHRPGAVSMVGRVNGVAMEPREYVAPGSHNYMASIPAEVHGQDPLRVEFELDRGIPPTPGEARELGVIAVDLRLV